MRKTYSLRLDTEIGLKWKGQAQKLGLTNSEYIETLLSRFFEEGILITDECEMFGYEKMIRKNLQEKYRLKRMSNVLGETMSYINKTLLYSTASWNSPIQNLNLDNCLGFVNENIEEAQKLKADKVLIDKLEHIKKIIKTKNENKILELICSEEWLKKTLYILCKKYDKNFNRVYGYFKGRKRDLNKITITGEVKDNE